jgi:pilus assembly protein CpaD
MRSAAIHFTAWAGRKPMPGFRAVLAASSIALLAGCAGPRDSITVGAVPDDYRTNHPIMISEKDEVLDLPVGTGSFRMTEVHKVAVNGYISNYDRSAAATVSIMVPSGSVNSAAANAVARDVAHHLHRRGVPSGRVVVVPYSASAESAAPIRLIYGRMKAHTGQCGRWPADVLDTTENKHYANFGCASQNNLAAQIANPADLLGPRAPGDIDADNRESALDQYKARQIAPDMRANREVFY